METSLYPSHHHLQQPHQLPSPTSHSSSSASNSQAPSAPAVAARSDATANNPYPTTFIQADTASFKQVVQMLTGSPRPKQTNQPDTPQSTRPPSYHSIPPIKSITNKKTSVQPNSSSSGFKLYERRNSLKNFKINPIFAPGSGFSPRNKAAEILSPSILDFPSLVLSPVTPLIPDPFDRSSSTNNSAPDVVSNTPSEEERAIKEKGFYLHPSPASTPRELEPPRLLPLFPVTSPRVSTGSADIPSSSSS